MLECTTKPVTRGYVPGLTKVFGATQLSSGKCVPSETMQGLQNTWRAFLSHITLYMPYYPFSFLWGSYHLSQQGWMRQVFIQNDLDALSTGYPQSASSLGYRTLYLVELGFWLSCCLYLAFETRRKDFVEMGIHHLSTVILISFSYLFDFSRPGLLIMTLHDIGDVFLYSAKSAQYKRYQGLADVLFVVFAISFYVTRLYVLPTYLFYGLARALWQGDASESMRTIKTHGSDRMLTWLVGIFGVLICLHFMWGAIIAKMVLRTLKSSDKKSVAKDGDPRSDSEAELETDVSPNGATGVVGTTKKNK